MDTVGHAYEIASSSFDPAGYLNKTQNRSFIIPEEKQSATFHELVELEGSDIVYHGSPYDSALSILRDKKIDIKKSRFEGDYMIHFTVSVETANPFRKGSGVIFPMYVRDLPGGLVPKHHYGNGCYSGDAGSGVSKVTVPMSVDERILNECDSDVSSILDSFLTKHFKAF